MHDALTDLRRTRRERRLGDLEWFDLAYRAYLAAIFGGGAVIVISDFVGDREVSASGIAEVFDAGPALVGLVAVLAVALGLRSGAAGGPVSLESADVQHLLLAPIPRHAVLTRPLVQRLRSVAFVAAVAGAIAGQLAAQRLPGSPAAWAASGGLAAAAIGALFVSAATVAHAARMRGSAATAVGTALVAVQVTAVTAGTPGPGDPIGTLALAGGDPTAFDDPGDVAAVLGALVVVALLIALAVVVVGRLRVDPLVRRGDLVSQLKFAVTMQDLRTVVLLRRQLREELPRTTPWVSLPSVSARSGNTAAVARRRGWHSLLRTPLPRLARMLAVAAGAGLAAHAVLEGTTPAIVVLGVLVFLLGLDVLEPLSQEIDHPGRTDALPVDRGILHLGLITAPMVALVPISLVGAAVVIALDPGRAPGALVLAAPVAWLGAAGAVVNIVRDSPTHASTESVMMPPEFAGFGTATRTLLPVLVSMIASVPVVVMRATPGPGAALRSLLAAALVLGAVAWWVRRRDRWRAQWTALLAGARP
jgi:hypothetical protein